MAQNSLFEITVPLGAAGERLDRFLASQIPTLTRSRLKTLLNEGHVAVTNPDAATITNAARRVKPGEIFVVTIPAATDAQPQGQDIPLTILYEDTDLIVIDKPAGLVVHPAAGNHDHTLVNALIAHCGASLSGIGGVKRPGIVHRLDKDTSGLMVVAKNDATHHALSRAFADRRIERAYLAVVWGVPEPRSGLIEGAIGRNPRDRKKMAVVPSGGKDAATEYKVLQPLGRATALIECRLRTGRTHQIRVHMTYIGHPLLGDPVYGRATPARKTLLSEPAQQVIKRWQRQALHANILGFIHPGSGQRLRWEAPPPPDMTALIAALKES